MTFLQHTIKNINTIKLSGPNIDINTEIGLISMVQILPPQLSSVPHLFIGFPSAFNSSLPKPQKFPIKKGI